MKLHIGCKGSKIEGFRRVDIVQWGDIDYVCDAKKLPFEDNTVEEIYASHILEHFPRVDTVDVLGEWFRVLGPGGVAYISVPDFDRIVSLYTESGRMLSKWFDDILHGGQNYDRDVHLRSFTFPVLSGLLSDAGFKRVDKLEKMPYGINDCSTLVDTLKRKPISVNVKGIK